jgi:hypothetical protein
MTIPQFTVGQVLTAAELNAMVDAINAGGAVKVERFTASGTWTVPRGRCVCSRTYSGRWRWRVTWRTRWVRVEHHLSHLLGGTVSASGGVGGYIYYHNLAITEQAGAANSGLGQ